MEPAIKIIAALGGTSKVAQIAGVHRSRVWNWTRAKADGGTGGIIPIRYIRKLIDAGASQGVQLRADDFLPIETPEETRA